MTISLGRVDPPAPASTLTLREGQTWTRSTVIEVTLALRVQIR